MDIKPTRIPDVLVMSPSPYRDERGYFFESYRSKEIATYIKKPVEFVQGNISDSLPYVLRGLHYQTRSPQGKFVRCTRGQIYDVCVDLRKNSPTFGRWVGVWLDNLDLKAVWVPPGFAHGFITGPQGAQVVYECTTVFDPASEAGLRWDDPTVAVGWPIHPVNKPILSAKDKHLPTLDKAVMPVMS